MLRSVVHGMAWAMCLLLLSCTGTRVTLQGQEVTDSTAHTAAVTLSVAEQTLTVATGAIRAGYQAGTISHAHATYFLEQVYTPGLQAILAGQDALTAYVQTKDADALTKLRMSMALVTYWLTEVQGLLAAPGGI